MKRSASCCARAPRPGTSREAETAIVEMALRLGDRRASAVMTPRTQIEWLDLDDPEAENRRKIRESAYSRFPVVQGGSQQVIGIVQAKDLLAGCLAGQPFDLRAATRPPLYLPNTVTVLRVLEVFKTAGEPMALIVDEYGDLEGLVTPSDILETLGRRYSGLARSRSAGRAPRRRNLADRRHGRARRVEAAARDLPPARRGPRFPYPGRLSDGTPQSRADGSRPHHRRRLALRGRQDGRPPRRPGIGVAGEGQGTPVICPAEDRREATGSEIVANSPRGLRARRDRSVASQVPASAQTLRIGLADDPDILDPTLGRTYVGRIVFAALCDKLVDIGPELEIVPQLATEWQWTDGNKGLS